MSANHQSPLIRCLLAVRQIGSLGLLLGGLTVLTAILPAIEPIPAPGSKLAAAEDKVINHQDVTTEKVGESIPVSAVGAVPGGYFGPVSRQLEFGRGVAGIRNPEGGVRLSVRVEL